jgi:hypothetical protein
LEKIAPHRFPSSFEAFCSQNLALVKNNCTTALASKQKTKMLMLRKTNQIKQICQCLSRNFAVTASLGSSDHYDIVIAGGGLVGIGLAASLGEF